MDLSLNAGRIIAVLNSSVALIFDAKSGCLIQRFHDGSQIRFVQSLGFFHIKSILRTLQKGLNFKSHICAQKLPFGPEKVVVRVTGGCCLRVNYATKAQAGT